MKETLPIILQKVSAGFPSPATDYIEEEINLNNELIKNPSSTFLIRVQGNSMLDYKIAEGDVLIVDRSLTLKNNSIAVLNFQGELVVKKIIKKKEKYFILSKENKRTKEIEISSSFDSELWGIVIYVIHKL
jgi:DNA polymerase V